MYETNALFNPPRLDLPIPNVTIFERVGHHNYRLEVAARVKEVLPHVRMKSYYMLVLVNALTDKHTRSPHKLIRTCLYYYSGYSGQANKDYGMTLDSQVGQDIAFIEFERLFREFYPDKIKDLQKYLDETKFKG